ncbi:MAG TPA: di-heme oxidoredictase family protein [Xanthobacteraceae bacterium]|nr:di-heme oxidoredictase family protein [Xanthobacteraceae bacterium]
MRTIAVLVAAVLWAPTAFAQTDPGPRQGPPGAGGPLPGLGTNELAFFAAARTNFQEVETFQTGLGPRMNLNQCSGCHIQPAVGGSSPSTNPQVAFAALLGPPNTVPSFVTASGPIREARFVRNPDGTPDGGVHDLFVVTPAVGAPAACKLAQPNFAQALAQNNVIFRIPTPLFGAGLVDNLNDAQLMLSFNANAPLKAALGIGGHFNTSGNDGTITKFGWKAQNKSLLIFAGEAYNVEMGVTNDNFPNERETDPNCATNPTPESTTNLTNPDGSVGNATVSLEVTNFNQDIVNFAAFMRLSAPPTAAPSAYPHTAFGQQVFVAIGCVGCHTQNFKTGPSAFTGQSGVTFSPFSDFAVHNMGEGLADGITQGNANGFEFRSAPLWGIGQRLFFLHDGRTTDLLQAIEAHASAGSEANRVIANFNALPNNAKQALLNFLRSL